MGPHVRTPLFSVALVTEFIHGIGFELGGAKPSVLFVTTRAFQFSFADGMVGGLVLLGPDALVAEIAEVRLGGLQILPGTGMDGVAVVAGDPLIFMPGHVPKGQILLLAMTGKTFGGFGFGVGDSLAEDEDAHAPFTAFFHVGRPGAMAGFTSILTGRAVWNFLFGVSGFYIAVITILMATLTDFHADGVVTSCIIDWENQGEKGDQGQEDEEGFFIHRVSLLK